MCRCAQFGKMSAAPLPQAAHCTPFGTRIHAMALFLKSNQLFSYERLQGALADLFGLKLSQRALMNMFKRSAPVFTAGRDDALATMRRAEVVACSLRLRLRRSRRCHQQCQRTGIQAKRHPEESHQRLSRQMGCRRRSRSEINRRHRPPRRKPAFPHHSQRYLNLSAKGGG